MENVFLEEISNGHKGRRIAFIYSSFDLMIIKSLFQSEQIPFFCEFEYLSKIKTGLPITQVNNIMLNVLEEDITDSKFILSEYIKTKKTDNTCKNKLRNICEFIIFSNAVPSPIYNTIRILGGKESNNYRERRRTKSST